MTKDDIDISDSGSNDAEPTSSTSRSKFLNKKILIPSSIAVLIIVVVLGVVISTSSPQSDSANKHPQQKQQGPKPSQDMNNYVFKDKNTCINDFRISGMSENDAFTKCTALETALQEEANKPKEDMSGPFPIDCNPKSDSQWYRTDNTFVIDPKNPKTMYVNVEYRGFYKSSDGGKTWKRKTKGIVVDHKDATTGEPCYGEYPVAVIDPTNTKRVLLATSGGGGGTIKDMNMRGGGVYETTNGGDSWHQKITDKMNGYVTHALVLDPKNPKVFYYGTAASPASYTEADPNKIWVKKGIIYKTPDNGKTWAELPTSFQKHERLTFIAIDPNNTKKIVASSILMVSNPNGPNSVGETQAGYIQTSDGGKTWKRIDNLPQGYVAPLEAAVAPTNFNHMFHVAATVDKPSKSFYSLDGARTWKESNTSLDVIKYDPHDKSGNRIVGYKWQCQSGPCGLTLYESTDAGASFHTFGTLPKEVSNLMDHKTRIQNIVWDPKTPSTLYLTGANGYVWRSTNNASSWETILSVDMLTLP